MNKKLYNIVMSRIKMRLIKFASTYYVNANQLFPQNDGGDTQWTIDLGGRYGKVNILLEGWNTASYNNKVNVLSIPMRFHTFRDNDKEFDMNGYHVNNFNGKLVPHYSLTDHQKMIQDFDGLLGKWSKGLIKIDKPALLEVFHPN